MSQLIRPRAQWLLDIVDKLRPDAKLGISLGHHSDLMIEQLAKLENNLFRFMIINPVADIECQDMNLKNVSVNPVSLSEIDRLEPVDVVLAFDYLDRISDPESCFNKIEKLLSTGGLFIANATLISGFDLQVLWDRSESIYPPDRLNLLSAEGVENLLNRHGFETIEFSAPGTFDVDIVKRAINNNPDIDCPRFIRYLIETRDENALRELQKYLQKNRLSSYGRIVAKKRVREENAKGHGC